MSCPLYGRRSLAQLCPAWRKPARRQTRQNSVPTQDASSFPPSFLCAVLGNETALLLLRLGLGPGTVPFGLVLQFRDLFGHEAVDQPIGACPIAVEVRIREIT